MQKLLLKFKFRALAWELFLTLGRKHTVPCAHLGWIVNCHLPVKWVHNENREPKRTQNPTIPRTRLLCCWFRNTAQPSYKMDKEVAVLQRKLEAELKNFKDTQRGKLSGGWIWGGMHHVLVAGPSATDRQQHFVSFYRVLEACANTATARWAVLRKQERKFFCGVTLWMRFLLRRECRIENNPSM